MSFAMFQDELEKHLQARNSKVLGKKSKMKLKWNKKKKIRFKKLCLSIEIENFSSNTKANWKQSPGVGKKNPKQSRIKSWLMKQF